MRAVRLLLTAAALLLLQPVFASPSTDWLLAQQQGDGHFGNAADLAVAEQATAETLTALRLLKAGDAAASGKAMNALAASTELNAEFLARRIVAGSQNGVATGAWVGMLLSFQNDDGGFGDGPGYHSTPLATAWALRALAAAGQAGEPVGYAVQYLLDQRGRDGGWGEASSILVTAEVVLSLNAYKGLQGVPAALTGARGFLLARQGADKLWSEDFQSALALSALAMTTGTSDELSAHAEALQGRMRADGSWQNEVYTTALALQALKRVQSGGPASLGKGSVQGRVLRAGSTEAIAGATVSVQGQAGYVLTGEDGRFLLGNIAEGPRTLVVQKDGFGTASLGVSVPDGGVADAGIVVLGQASSTARIAGHVFADADRRDLAGVSISLSGPRNLAATTDAHGVFELTGLPAGTYQLRITAAGFHALSGTLTAPAGGVVSLNQGLVAEGQVLLDEPVALSGRIVDGATGAALAGATVAVAGDSVVTDGDGRFTTAAVARGEQDLRISAGRYETAQYHLSIPAGASGALGDLAIHAKTETTVPSRLDVLATVLDGVSGLPIAGASVQVAGGPSASTDAEGRALLKGLISLEFELALSAAGYSAQGYQVKASGFGSTAASFSLTPASPDTGSLELSGVVRDKATNLGLAGATVEVVGTALKATTGADGAYRLSDIATRSFGLRVSAGGYQTQQQNLSLSQDGGRFTLDFALAATASQDLRVLAVDAPAAVEPDSAVQLKVRVENRAGEARRALLLAQIRGIDGQAVAELAPYAPDTESVTPEINLAAGASAEYLLPWAVAQTPAGAYSVLVRLVEPGTLSRELPSGEVLDQGVADLSVSGALRFGGGFDVNPPLTQAGARTPVQLGAVLRNTGNQALPAGNYKLVVRKPGAEILLERSLPLEDIALNEVRHLDFGPWTPEVTVSGQLALSLRREDGIPGEIAGQLYVGDVATAQFTVDKSVLLEGDSALRGTVRLTGVDTTIGTGTDPLFALVKTAVEKGGAFTAPRAQQWHESNRCLGCHIQTQSLAGLAAAKSKASIDWDKARFLFNAVSTAQRANGGIESSHPEYGKTATQFATWSLTEWPQKQDAVRTTSRALQYLWERRAVAGDKTYWVPDHHTGWLNSNEAATALTVLTAARTLRALNSLDLSLVSDFMGGAPWPMNAGQSGRKHKMAAWEGKLYIAKDNGWLERMDPSTGQVEVLRTSLPGISGRVNGWTRDAGGNEWFTTQAGAVVKRQPDGSMASYNLGTSGLGDIVQAGDGNFYITSFDSSRIYRLTPDGVSSVFAQGGLLRNPFGLQATPEGELLVANYSGFNLLKFTLSGEGRIFAAGLVSRPLYLAMGQAGEAFVTLESYGGFASSVIRVRADGLAENLAQGTSLWGVATTGDGGVYVAEASSLNNVRFLARQAFSRASLDGYRAAMPDIARYLRSTLDANDIDNTRQALRLIGLAELRDQLSDETLRAQVDASIEQLAQLLRGRQKADGSWGRYTSWGGDALSTALVGIALEYTSPSPQDPMVRKAITYLLNSQQGNGSWHSGAGLFSTDLGTTSLVMVYMPKALDRLGGLDVKLGLDFPANVAMSNPTIAPTETTPLADGGRHYLWDLKGVTGAGRQLDFDLDAKAMALGETRPVAALAELSFRNSFTEEALTRPIAIPEVKALSQLALSVVTDKVVYGAGERVAIGGRAGNAGPAFNGGQVLLSIRPAGYTATVASLPAQAVGALAQGAGADVATAWNTGTTLAGDYEVFGQLVDDRGRVVAQATARFRIAASTAEGSAQAGAQVFTDRPVYQRHERAALTSRALNRASNALLPAGLGRLVVKDPDGKTVLSRSYVVPELVSNALRAYDEGLGFATLPLGEYSVSWKLYDAAGTRLLASAEAAFIVQERLADNLAGKVTIPTPRLELGQTLVCRDEVSNRSALSGLAFELRQSLLRLADGETVLSTSSQRSLPAGQSLQLSRELATGGLAEGEYLCLLDAVVDGQERRLGYDAVTLVQPPIKLSGSLSLGTRGRLLVMVEPLDWRYDTGVPAVAAQRAFLESLLRDNGWSYTLVDSNAAFLRELRTGAYSAHALFADNFQLHMDEQRALRELTHGGAGLLFTPDFAHASNAFDTKALESALGAAFGNKQGTATGLKLDAGPFAPTGGSLAFGRTATVRGLNPQGASRVAAYQGLSGHGPLPEHAVMANGFGRGHGFVTGFDWLPLATAAQGQAANPLATLLLQSLDFLQPAALPQGAGDVLPVRITVSNERRETQARVGLALPAGAAMVDAGAFTLQADGQWQSSFPLAAGASLSQTVYLRLPEGVSELRLPVRIEAKVGEAWVEQFAQVLAVAVTPSGGADSDLANAIAKLEQYIGQGGRRGSVQPAISQLRSAQAALAGQQYSQVCTHLLSAANALDGESHALITEARLILDAQLKQVLRRL